jgi:hypothetical protein
VVVLERADMTATPEARLICLTHYQAGPDTMATFANHV